MYCYDFYLGLTDKDTFEDIDARTALNEVSHEFLKLDMPFSITIQKGGYLHKDGTYVIENSLKISIVNDLNQDEVSRVVNFLKRFYNQERILLVKTKVEAEFHDGSSAEELIIEK